MKHTEQWIWLPKDWYPNAQKTKLAGVQREDAGNYVVAEFERTYTFPSAVVSAKLRFSGDTAFQLFCNGGIVATGPACVGGDFIGNDSVRENCYAFETEIEPKADTLAFFARVRMTPVQICEYSHGQGGFMLSAILTLEDGTQQQISTDESWLARKNGSYKAADTFDGSILPDEYVSAECIEDIWHTQTAPIPVREEREPFCENSEIFLQPHEEKTEELVLDRIWAGFVCAKAEAQGKLAAEITCRELDEDCSADEISFDGNGEYRGFTMKSAGNILVKVKNDSDFPAKLVVSFVETHYPICAEGHTVTSDADMNQVLDTCKHTLKICRQTHHLDSPRHCEPLACTGDYYIETLMTLFSFGDMGLAAFDLQRTAVLLERENGRMFHNTYSMIWIRMLWDVYMAQGDIELLRSCEQGLEKLLARFAGYVGENGLIEKSPDYMFVDWIYIDEISMHHPPKALGQTALNMFYFGGLDYAAKIYTALGKDEAAELCAAKREKLRKAILQQLFDAERGCFFEGLNTPTDPSLYGEWMPENVEKRYSLKHSNILAAYFGVCDDELGRELVRKIMAEEIGGDVQPYFTHYLLEAVYRLGLREEYTRRICDRWKAPVRSCTKGLVEGFVKPEPTYSFDHSHAWGGTPLYSLPKALMGLEIAAPGMKEITLDPSLLGYDHAEVELLTPYGTVKCSMKQGEAPQITAPKEICVKGI